MTLLVIGGTGVALSQCGVINDVGVIELYQSHILPSSDSNILLSFFICILSMDAPGNANKGLNYVNCDGMYRKFGIYIMIG